MKCLCWLRLFGLLSIPSAVQAVPRHLRASPSLLDVSRQLGGDLRGVRTWDYADAGVSWTDGTCASTGTSQSPINVSTTSAAAATDEDSFFFSYPAYETPVKMVNDGRFLYTMLPNSDGKVGGVSLGTSYPDHLTVSWWVYKMVIHTPSEHTFGGVKVPLELQLFHHKSDATLTNGEPAPADTAVVAVGFAESRAEASPFLKSLIDGGLPDQRGGETMDNRAYPSVLRFSELFKPVFGANDGKAGFWDYTGSLTQPPCTDGVRWFVRDQTLNAKATTLKLFTDVVVRSSGGAKGSARELQAVGSPVFGRFAVNAVHMTVFNPATPASFTDAEANVAASQQAFKDGLTADEAGAAATVAAGGDSTEVLASSAEYTECLDTLGSYNTELETAQSTQTNDCNTAEGYQQTLDSIAGGPARIEAAQKAASASKTCEDHTNVVNAKQGQKDAQEADCQSIKSEKEKLAESNTTAAATETTAATTEVAETTEATASETFF